MLCSQDEKTTPSATHVGARRCIALDHSLIIEDSKYSIHNYTTSIDNYRKLVSIV
jgi:hypothetical protein